MFSSEHTSRTIGYSHEARGTVGEDTSTCHAIRGWAASFIRNPQKHAVHVWGTPCGARESWLGGPRCSLLGVASWDTRGLGPPDGSNRITRACFLSRTKRRMRSQRLPCCAKMQLMRRRAGVSPSVDDWASEVRPRGVRLQCLGVALAGHGCTRVARASSRASRSRRGRARTRTTHCDREMRGLRVGSGAVIRMFGSGAVIRMFWRTVVRRLVGR